MRGQLAFSLAAGAQAFHIALISRKGVLPEADFYAPIPYQSLLICTDAAIDELIAEVDGDLLDRAFELLTRNSSR